MWAFLVFGFVWAVGLVLSTAPSSAEAARLSGEKIKTTLAGAVLELDTPLGTKVPIRFAKDGMMNGEAGALGAYLGADRDRGRWWVSGDRLCMKWFKWFEAAVHCFSLQIQGNRIHWQEQGGRSGTATIASRPKEEPPVRPVIASVMGAPKQSDGSPKRADAQSNVAQPGQENARAGAIGRTDADGSLSAAAVEKQSAPIAEPRELAPATQVAEVVDAKPVARSEAREDLQPVKPVAIPPVPIRATAARAVPQPVPVRRAFRVVRVAADDVLNVRSGPSESHMAIGAIEPDGRGIDIVGPCRGLWCPIRYGRTSGWVNSYYLAPEWAEPTMLVGSR